MIIFYYIIIAMIAAIMLAGSVAIVFKAGEKELLTKYGQEDEKQ